MSRYSKEKNEEEEEEKEIDELVILSEPIHVRPTFSRNRENKTNATTISLKLLA